MWIHQFTLALTLLVFSSDSKKVNTDLKIDELTTNINQNSDGDISKAEVDSFFDRTWGKEATICQFTEKMDGKFVTYSITSSMLFNVLKNDPSKTTLSKDGFTKVLLEGSNAVTVSSFKKKLESLDAKIIKLYNSPQENDLSPLKPPSAEMIALFDVDGNSLVTRGEISGAMTKSFDKNGDAQVKMCEFIETADHYQYSPFVAAQLHVSIFGSEDKVWSDDFAKSIEKLADKNGDKKVTNAELKELFEKGTKQKRGRYVTLPGRMDGKDPGYVVEDDKGSACRSWFSFWAGAAAASVSLLFSQLNLHP